MKKETIRRELSEIKTDELRLILNGKVFLPGTEEYEQSRISWNLVIDQHPAVIVEVSTVDDVLHTVKFAEANDLKIAVQSTGHGTISPCDGQLLIRTSKLNRVTIYDEQKTVHVEAGATWAEVVNATHATGLAPLSGFAPTVGVVGYTLSGGFGWMARKHGIAVDSLVSVDLVTVGGEIIHADASSNADLFWGICGGGTNLGIITAIEMKLFGVGHAFTGKFLFPAERSPEILEAYRTWSSGLPEELTSNIKIAKLPPAPNIPEYLRGMHVVIISGCYLGSAEKGLELFQPIRALRPFNESLAILDPKELSSFSGEPAQPLKLYVHVELLDELTTEFLQKLSARILTDHIAKSLFFELRHVGDGAMSKINNDRSAFCHRQTRYMLNIISLLAPDMDHEMAASEIQPLITELNNYTSGNTFSNFLGHGDDNARVKSAYTPESLEKLLRLKAQYDPQNTLLSNL